MNNINTSVKFEIIEKIAEGGMGSVFKAVQKGAEGFEKTVAIKTLLENYSNNEIFVKMFINEAKLVANLIHENIVQIYQLEKYEDTYFFILEFIDGISLFDFLNFHIKQNSLLPRELSVYIASRIARGLAYAHSRIDADGNPLNIVHCDVCPHNILITSEGLPKLTDFGIAKAANFVMDDSLSIAGKLPFMSPEQARSEDLDYRSDIYSLGVVLFYMISGSHTRTLDKGVSNILKQAKEAYVDWDKLPEDIDEELLNIIHKMLAKTPEGRYQDTNILGRELEYYIYKDGYGPTIVTLANYMREQMPHRFNQVPKEVSYDSASVLLNEKTTVMM